MRNDKGRAEGPAAGSPKPRPVHYARRADFIAVQGESIIFRSSYAGHALCSFTKQPPTDAPVTCKRCIAMLVRYVRETAAAQRFGLTIEKAKAIVYGREQPAAQRPQKASP